MYPKNLLPSDVVVVPVRDGELRYWPQALDATAASRLFDELRAGIDWATEEIVIFGQRGQVPRLVAWYGDPGAAYTYSGTVHDPRPWTPALLGIRERVSALTGVTFNSVLLNLYRDGRDSMGWHADDEPELGPDPAIASVSLGAMRRFRLRHRRDAAEPLTLPLAHGSLLLMAGALQHHWVHALPKAATPVGERINLTFRNVRVLR